MPSIQQVHSDLPNLKSFGPLVAVFVGGTSGIGEYTARAFVQNAARPHVYLVGRNEEQASKLKSDFQKLNPESQTTFIKGDVSLLQNVDRICEEIKASEDKINLLFLSAGMLTLSGRDETQEGLDKKFSLHYYSRLRFTTNLLPLLNKAADSATNGKPMARVFSVLGAGLEGTLNFADLSLKRNFALGACATHAITMNTLMLNRLAVANPRVSFIHTQPGAVETNLHINLNPILQLGVKAIYLLAKPWYMTATESGQRHCWESMADQFKSRGTVYLAGSKGDIIESAVVGDATTNADAERVFEHTQKVFRDICDTPGSKYNGD